MTKIIGAPTLDDAIAKLAETVAEFHGRGERVLVFCEDRLTLMAERAVLQATGGTFFAEVTTFKRFLSGSGATLSKQGSVMAMETILSSCEGELGCFKAGCAQAVYETIAQLAASGIGAEELRRAAEETEGSLRVKLGDLALLLEKYGEFLRARGLVDENGYLMLLPKRIEEGALNGVNAVFFAFPSFTRRALDGVDAALLHAASVTGIFVAGTEDLYTNEGATAFRREAEKWGEVCRILAPCSLEGEAETLRKVLFSPGKLPLTRGKTSRIRTFSAEDETEEMEKIAALVRRYVCGGEGKPYRYRDLAVLVPDASYFSVAEKVFTAHKIPFFADKKRPFSEHPFCTFALAVINAVHDRVLPAEADDIASSYYFGGADDYRNYLLKYGRFRNAVEREIKTGDAVKKCDRARLTACRERMKSILAVFKRKGTGREYAAGVRALFALVGGEERTKELAEGTEGAEREFLSAEPLWRVLTEIESVAGERTFTAREFAKVFESGLKALEISMIPQYADALFVGDVTESRIYRAGVLFCAGLTDALPRAAADTAVVTDGEIARLNTLKVCVEPAIAQVNARARENFALNLCAFREGLYMSCPDRKGGEETARSEAFYYLERTFLPATMSEVFPYNCTARGPAELCLLGLKNAFEEGRTDEMVSPASVLSALEARGEGERVRRLFQTEKERVPALRELYFRGQVSPTLLESYFSCPYASFASRGLRLEEREERSVLDTDTGTFVHAVLERTAKKFGALSSEEECRAAAREESEALMKEPRFSALTDTAAGEYAAERLLIESAEVTAAAYRQLKGSSFCVGDTEEVLAIPSLSLKGKADRVDYCGDYVRIIDYKTGHIDDNTTSYYTGRQLQLELYLLAAAEQGGKVPAGAFYFPASDDYRTEGKSNFCMLGFYRGEKEIVSLFDTSLKEGEKSEFFGGSLEGSTQKGMKEEEFENFLGYAKLVAEGAEREMKEGVILPVPYEGACTYCKFGGMCGFVGEPRKERTASCSEVAAIAEKEKKA